MTYQARWASLEARFDVAPPTPEQFHVGFVVLLGHILFSLIRRMAVPWLLWPSVGLGLVVLVVLLFRWRLLLAWPVALGAAVASIYRAHTDFPDNANHHLLEMMVSVFLCLALVAGWGNREVARVGRFVAIFLLANLWGYSALQKLLNGRWLTGDFTGYFLCRLSPFSSYLLRHAGPEALPLEAGAPQVAAPMWLAATMPAIGAVLPVLQLVIPALVLFRRTKRHALFVFVVLELSVGILALELEFLALNLAMTGLAFAPSVLRRRVALVFLCGLALMVVSGPTPWIRAALR